MSKILIIGIDGGTWDVLTPAINHGAMPNLKKIIDSSASGILESTMPAITPAAWGSFQTGVNCGRNGVFDFSYWDKLENKTRFVSSSTLQTTLWEMASDAGKRVATINVPMTYPPRKINGCMVTGILTPSLESEFTYPPDLKEKLLHAVPDYHIFNLQNAGTGSPHENFEGFIDQMVDIVDSRTKAAKFLIDTDDFDLFMVHFQTTDIVQHAMWGYMDENYPLYDANKRDYIFEHFYKHLDAKIKEVRDAFSAKAGDDFLTLFVSDHGQEAHKKRINLGNWLCDQGLLKINPIRKKNRPLLKKITSTLKVGKLLRLFISEQSVKKMERSVGLNFEQIDLQNSSALSIGRSGEGFIYLLKDDEQENERLKDDIITGLKNICDPCTGEKVVKNVFRKEDIYSGSFMHRMPDLVVEPVSGYSFTGWYQLGEGLFHNVEPIVDFHIGKHHKNGIIIASGKDVRHSDTVKARLIDIVPTLLYYMQLPVKDDLDGQIVFDLFTDQFRQTNDTPGLKKYKEAPGKQESEYSKKEESEIEQRLKDLGYF
ncbi:MAG: alkaline phosphatase family protein [Phycisphaerae bacterium]|nr:alkaline phosphatase family protein [Phycisphaerae bacterium]